MIRNLLALTGLLALALVAAVTLQAQGYFDEYTIEDEPPPREAVSIDGLDLSSAAGVRLLEDRVNAAIDRVCPDDRTKRLKRVQAIRECRQAAIASVRPQIDRAVARAEARYADLGPAPQDRWRDTPAREFYRDPPPPLPAPDYPPAPAPLVHDPRPATAPPPPGARLVRRTTTTTVTRTTGAADIVAPAPTVAEHAVVARRYAVTARPPVARRAVASPAGDCCVRRSPAYARRAAVAHSWLPPVAWAEIERATLRAFRTGGLVRWHLTDRDGIERAGYVSVSAVRWLAGCPCRNVQVVKYVGARQLVVAAGMRCLARGRLVNRSR